MLNGLHELAYELKLFFILFYVKDVDYISVVCALVFIVFYRDVPHKTYIIYIYIYLIYAFLSSKKDVKLLAFVPQHINETLVCSFSFTVLSSGLFYTI